ncbi:Transmembrane protein 135 [Nymphon striatum]|nr:Transmembrane protein 135 [Nymphon striatum]
MMTTLSKISVPKDEPFNCYEVAHVWNPSCKESAIDIFFDTVISSSKVYAPFYLISILTRRKFLTLDVFLKYVRDVCTSSLFLSFNTSGFLSLFCLMRQLLGKFDRKASYLAAAVASYIAIKRQALALYVTNVASETLFWMLQSRGLVRKIPYGDILLMSISSAVLLLLYRRQKLCGVVPAVLNIMLDKNNDQKKAEVNAASTNNSNILLSKMYRLASYIHKLVRTNSQTKSLYEFIIKLISKPKHKLCCHQYGCFYYSIKAAVKVFSIGYMGRLSFSFFMNVMKKCFKTSHQLTSGLKHRSYIKFGSFLAAFVLLNTLCDCLWRHVFDCDSSKQALASGFIAGLSISIYRSPSISVYLFWKAVEALWLQLQEKYPNLNFPQGIELLYSCSTALLITAGTLEAHNVRPEYITFLKQITNNRFGTINRILLDEFSTTQKASTYFPYFFMVSDLEKTSSGYKAILAKLKNSGLMKYLV